jgi:hypothetical protein
MTAQPDFHWHQPGRGPGHLRPGRSAAARRLRARQRRLHLQPALGALHRCRPRHLPTPVRAPGRSVARAGLRGVHCRRAEPGCKDRIPRFEEISERLHRATRWEVVAVPGLIPEEAFFALLAQRRFPVTRLDPQARGVRLHRRARRLPRPVRPCAAAVQPDVRRLHAGYGAGRPEGEPARGLRDAGAPVLVHHRVRADPTRRRACAPMARAS